MLFLCEFPAGKKKLRFVGDVVQDSHTWSFSLLHITGPVKLFVKLEKLQIIHKKRVLIQKTWVYNEAQRNYSSHFYPICGLLFDSGLIRS